MLKVIGCLLVLSTFAEATESSFRAAVRHFGRLDRDSDDSLTLAEFSRAVPGSSNPRRACPAACAAIFDWFDWEGDDAIDLGEWTDGKSDGPSNYTPVFTQDVWAELDLNRDGSISRREFNRVFSGFLSRKVADSWYATYFANGGSPP
jgi:Ca2+-binding EF-hand superfamily protein